ncbi:MAG: hypothetical protein Q8P95_04710 [bacterium]|nr:hypothetical protein [bacterium]
MKEKSDFFKGGGQDDLIVDLDSNFPSEFSVGFESDEFEFEADFDMSEEGENEV